MSKPLIRRQATQAEIEEAERDYAVEGYIEFDNDAVVSDALPHGIWVQGWVWLDREEDANE